jgi:hypothetical protein
MGVMREQTRGAHRKVVLTALLCPAQHGIGLVLLRKYVVYTILSKTQI